jgi:predicted nucleic acid-binding protein
MKVVLDSSPIIGLVKGNCWLHLRSLCDAVLIPPQVEREVVGEHVGRPGSQELAQAVGDWVEVIAPSPAALEQAPENLEEGERAVLAVAFQQGIRFVVIDERSARAAATRLGLRSLTSVDVVFLLKQKGLWPAIKPTLDLMKTRGYGIRRSLYRAALRDAGE